MLVHHSVLSDNECSKLCVSIYISAFIRFLFFLSMDAGHVSVLLNTVTSNQHSGQSVVWVGRVDFYCYPLFHRLDSVLILI